VRVRSYKEQKEGPKGARNGEAEWEKIKRKKEEDRRRV
jgi:hypothetical protein